MKNFKVQCECPTPLQDNPFTCEAADEIEAVAKFKLHNGIADTVHPIKAEETDGESGELAEGDKSGEVKLTEKDQIKAYLAANPEATNKQVVEALAELGTVVTSSQVSAARKDV